MTKVFEETKKSKHLTEDELLDYYAQRLSASRQRLAEEHLADCSHCIREARAIYPLFGSFEAVWEDWIAHNQKAAKFQSRLVAALQRLQAGAKNADLRKRLKNWQAAVTKEASRALGAIVEALDQPWRILDEALAELAPVRTRGEATRGEPQMRAIQLTQKKPFEQFTLKKDHAVISILITGVTAGKEPPLVLLMPMGERGESQFIKATLHDPMIMSFKAKFTLVLAGDYVVFLEPPEKN